MKNRPHVDVNRITGGLHTSVKQCGMVKSQYIITPVHAPYARCNTNVVANNCSTYKNMQNQRNCCFYKNNMCQKIDLDGYHLIRLYDTQLPSG